MTVENEHEREIAVREAESYDYERSYFGARPALASEVGHRIFRAGFERGWNAARPEFPFGLTDTQIEELFDKLGGVSEFCKTFGILQFARAIERAHGIEKSP